MKVHPHRMDEHTMDIYGNILLATDFSDASRAAVRKAREIADCFHARLRLLHVIDYFPEDLPMDWIPPENLDPATWFEQEAQRRLQQLAGELGIAADDTETLFSSRAAAIEIAHAAERHGADLIVIGSHGRRGIGRLLGSTAHGVLHRAPCDVLTVRSG